MISGCNTNHFPESPKTAKDYYQRGVYYHNKNLPLQAIPEYTQAIALDQRYTDAYFMRGLSNSVVNNYNAANADLTQAIKLRPKQANYYRFRAMTYEVLEDVNNAIADYDKAIALDPANYRLCLNKAGLLFQEARFAEAVPAYKTYIEKSPKVADEVTSAFVTGGLILVATDPWGQIKTAKLEDQRRAAAKEMIQLCEMILQQADHPDAARVIVPDMPRQTVLQIVMPTDKPVVQSIYLGKELLVTVSRNGPLEDRNLRLLLFDKSHLTLEKRVPLKEIMEIPGTSKPTDISMNPTPPRSVVKELIRKTDRIIYEDDRQIVAVTEWETIKGKRVRIFNFDKDKLTMWSYGSIKLW